VAHCTVTQSGDALRLSLCVGLLILEAAWNLTMTENSKHAFQKSSPLESLVRRASSRRTKQVSSPPADNTVGSSDQQVLSNPSTIIYDRQQKPQPGRLDINLIPPRNYSPAPPSPLLHAHFRNSVATTSSNDQSFQRGSGLFTQQDGGGIYFDGPSSYRAVSFHLAGDILSQV
jgi:hypothetical protein